MLRKMFFILSFLLMMPIEGSIRDIATKFGHIVKEYEKTVSLKSLRFFQHLGKYVDSDQRKKDDEYINALECDERSKVIDELVNHLDADKPLCEVCDDQTARDIKIGLGEDLWFRYKVNQRSKSTAFEPENNADFYNTEKRYDDVHGCYAFMNYYNEKIHPGGCWGRQIWKRDQKTGEFLLVDPNNRQSILELVAIYNQCQEKGKNEYAQLKRSLER